MDVTPKLRKEHQLESSKKNPEMMASQRITTRTGALTDVVNAKNGKTLWMQNAKNQDSINMDVGFEVPTSNLGMATYQPF